MAVTASEGTRQIERIALAASLMLGIAASIWVFASRELSDFLGEGPVRVFGLEDAEQQLLIGSGTLAAVLATGLVTTRRLPLWRHAIGGVALLMALALAPPLFVPVLALYTLGFGAALLAQTPRERVAALAPRRHPLAWAGGGVVGLAAVVAVAWVSVWLLRPLWDEGRELDEALAFEVSAATAVASPSARPSLDATLTATPASPVEAMSTVVAAASTPTPGQAGTVLATGQLQGTDSFHFGSGSVRLLRGPGGEVVLRFEEYEVRNGPDLFVYLTPDAGGDVDVAGALDLGAIWATRGNVNYEVPAGVDTSAFRSAVIWCRSFDVVFAVATFE